MKRMAMAFLAVIVLAAALYWVPLVSAREIACDLPQFESALVCP